MSVTLQEVLENAGYDITRNIDDAKWFLDQDGDYNELYRQAWELEDYYNDYLDAKEMAEDDGDYNYPSFNEWRELQDE